MGYGVYVSVYRLEQRDALNFVNASRLLLDHKIQHLSLYIRSFLT